jgi:hypothetical protein
MVSSGQITNVEGIVLNAPTFDESNLCIRTLQRSFVIILDDTSILPEPGSTEDQRPGKQNNP